jgi:GNAT superfamily N-acetyltransferase
MPDAPRTLRRATLADAPALHALLAAAGEALARQGFANWLPPYPLARLTSDVAARDVYVVYPVHEREAPAPLATFTLGRDPVRPYDPAPWPRPDAPALYLNRLAVDPARQGRGVGAWCLARIDALARDAGVVALRADVLAANTALCAFYERHGWVARGDRTHSGWTFTCYERSLDG